jgi:hypothetical protein
VIIDNEWFLYEKYWTFVKQLVFLFFLPARKKAIINYEVQQLASKERMEGVSLKA